MSDNTNMNRINKIEINKEASLNTNNSDRSIIFLFYNKNLVMIYNSIKKVWEFPLCKKKDNETIIECIERETYRQTGAIIKSIVSLGYFLENEDGLTKKTTIYLGDVHRFETRSEWSEGHLVKLFDELPENVLDNNLYELVLSYIKSEKISF